MTRDLVLNLVLWAGVAAAAAAAIDSARAPRAISVLAAAAPAPAAPAEPEPAAPPRPARAAFAAIADRPLFTPGRRPPPMAETPTDAGDAGLGATLIGVVGAESDRLALVRDDAGETHRLRSGDRFGSWTVAGVESRRIVLRHAGREAELRLGEAGDAAGGGAAAASRKGRTGGGGAAPRPVVPIGSIGTDAMGYD